MPPMPAFLKDAAPGDSRAGFNALMVPYGQGFVSWSGSHTECYGSVASSGSLKSWRLHSNPNSV